MRYYITDSHRNMTKKRREALTDFFMAAKGIDREKAYDQTAFCDWFESEYAVKWFEVTANEGDAVTGYLRCMRNPDDLKEWYIGDVYVLREFRRKGVATVMYGKATEELFKFEAAERLIVTVNHENTASRDFHLKMGFTNTGEPLKFASFFDDPDETVYLKKLLKTLPFPENVPDEKIKVIIRPVWEKYCETAGIKGKKKAEERLSLALRTREEENKDFKTIWCGNSLVGLHYDGKDYISDN